MIKFKSKSFVMGLLIAASSLTRASSVVLPNFNTADKFGGSRVERLDDFVPTCNDFTLEVDAIAGTAIEIGFSHINYTPTQNGVVRFVQKDGCVYIFENNTYVTSQMPSYKYTSNGQNLISNGSFETVSEQLTTGRWIAADWDTWDGGTPTWGGDVGYVNIRENETKCSEGSKSIILHSRSKWLCQQMTGNVLKPGMTYCLTCDYWTSDGVGNGNGKYELWLGSSFATNDILTIDGYTTIEGDYSRQSFTTIFQMPQTLPADIYLSFYRKESKVDWLDNVKLVMITPEGQGISGTSNATYRTGAYAPQSMILPEGTSIDMTGRLINPNFDNATMQNNAPTGWTIDANVTQSKISTGAKGNLIVANQNHWQLWHSNGALVGTAHQSIKDMPNGRYILSADVVTTGYGGSISLFANYGKTLIASGSTKRYQVKGIVTNGMLDLGIDLATTGGVTIDFDSFTLQYEGIDIEGYREVLTYKISLAKKTLSDLEEGYDAFSINKVVLAAENLPADAGQEEVIAAIASIDKALEDYQVYVDKKNAERKNLEHFRTLVSAAETERNANTYPGIDAFDSAIALAKEFLVQLEKDMTLSTTENVNALNKAREAYYNSQYTLLPTQQTISYVDHSLNGFEKYVLRIDGKPYYGTEIQMRPDKLRGYEGWSESEIEATFERAAKDGFNTLSIPLFWSEVEPEKNYFDWRILDTYLTWCKKYGVNPTSTKKIIFKKIQAVFLS